MAGVLDQTVALCGEAARVVVCYTDPVSQCSSHWVVASRPTHGISRSRNRISSCYVDASAESVWSISSHEHFSRYFTTDSLAPTAFEHLVAAQARMGWDGVY